jgi:peptidoglycan hydrolase CwlO-like protein
MHSVSYLLIQDINVADDENEISQTQLQKLHVTSRLKGLQQSLDEMNVSTHQQNELISKSEGLITRNNALIERKQTQIDQMNKKIDHKLSSMDGVSCL